MSKTHKPPREGQPTGGAILFNRQRLKAETASLLAETLTAPSEEEEVPIDFYDQYYDDWLDLYDYKIDLNREEPEKRSSTSATTIGSRMSITNPSGNGDRA